MPKNVRVQESHSVHWLYSSIIPPHTLSFSKRILNRKIMLIKCKIIFSAEIIENIYVTDKNNKILLNVWKSVACIRKIISSSSYHVRIILSTIFPADNKLSNWPSFQLLLIFPGVAQLILSESKLKSGLLSMSEWVSYFTSSFNLLKFYKFSQSGISISIIVSHPSGAGLHIILFVSAQPQICVTHYIRHKTDHLVHNTFNSQPSINCLIYGTFNSQYF